MESPLTEPPRTPSRLSPKSESVTGIAISPAGGLNGKTEPGSLTDRLIAGTAGTASAGGSGIVTGTGTPRKPNTSTTAPSICLHILLQPAENETAANVVMDFMREAEETYGYERLHPEIRTALDLLNDADDEGMDDDDNEDIDLMAGEGQQRGTSGKPGQPTTVIGGAVAGATASTTSNPASAPSSKRGRIEGKYDLNDPFIDDSELQWEEQAASTKDGFFVYSGPLVQEGEQPTIERADGTIKKPKDDKSGQSSTKQKGGSKSKKKAASAGDASTANANGGTSESTAAAGGGSTKRAKEKDGSSGSAPPKKKAKTDASGATSKSTQKKSSSATASSKEKSTKKKAADSKEPKEPKETKLKQTKLASDKTKQTKSSKSSSSKESHPIQTAEAVQPSQLPQELAQPDPSTQHHIAQNDQVPGSSMNAAAYTHQGHLITSTVTTPSPTPAPSDRPKNLSAASIANLIT